MEESSRQSSSTLLDSYTQYDNSHTVGLGLDSTPEKSYERLHSHLDASTSNISSLMSHTCRKPRIKQQSSSCRRRATVDILFNHIMTVLRNEWKTLKSTNLGVRSGTGIVADVAKRLLYRHILDLQEQVISFDTAADQLAELVTQLTQQELHQLQVLLDFMGFELLTDYIRCRVYHSTSLLTHPVLPSDGRLSFRNNSPAASKPLLTNQHLHASREPIHDTLRFAEFLPPQHPLVQVAYALHDRNQASTHSPSTPTAPVQEFSRSSISSDVSAGRGRVGSQFVPAAVGVVGAAGARGGRVMELRVGNTILRPFRNTLPELKSSTRNHDDEIHDKWPDVPSTDLERMWGWHKTLYQEPKSKLDTVVLSPQNRLSPTRQSVQAQDGLDMSFQRADASGPTLLSATCPPAFYTATATPAMFSTTAGGVALGRTTSKGGLVAGPLV